MDNNIRDTEEVQYEIAEEPVTESSKVENDGIQSTVLAEFSSVVADTQQYLETDAEESASIVQHVTVSVWVAVSHLNTFKTNLKEPFSYKN